MNHESGVLFFVKLVKQLIGNELCYFNFKKKCIVNLKGGVMSTSLCNLFVFRDLYYKV